MWQNGPKEDASMRYGIINSTYELKSDYMDLDMLEYSLRDKDYTLVNLNTAANTLKWKDQDGPHLLQINEKVSAAREGIWKESCKAVKLIEQLANMISVGSTVMFTDVTQVTPNPDEMFHLYKCFVEHGIQLEFLHSPWLDSSNYYVSALKNPVMVNRIIDRVIISTYKSVEDKSNATIAGASDSNEEGKKNRYDDCEPRD